MKYLLFAFLFISQLAFSAGNPHVVMDTNFGKIELELFQKKSPGTVKNFLTYVNEKFYDGTIFHRVIDNFMIQGGGFEKGLKEKKTHGPIKNEAVNEVPNKAGTIAMARTKYKHSATAQFFINIKDNDFLNYRGAANYGYAVFGKVVKGMSVINKIKKVATSQKGLHQNVPKESVIIKSVRVKK